MKRKILFLCVLMWGIVTWAQTTTEFEKMVMERGLKEGVTDISDMNKVEMEEPRLAFVNLTGFTAMPTTKKTEKQGWMEVYDGHGRYFKKAVTLHAQGGYSLKHPKRNFVCHFCDSLWNEEGGTDFKIGDWVKQSSFHFKAFYTDFLRGIGEVGYKLYAQMVADRPPFWQRVGYEDGNPRARCFPDAFPCVVYLNGKFYGIFAWQLKKSRKNMNMQEDVATHIHLDGNLNDNNIFQGKINWNQFEVRNPKPLYAIEDTLYDGNQPKELMGDTCAKYRQASDSEEVKEIKERSNAVKQSIIQMSHYWKELEQLLESGANRKTMRQEIERRYEIGSLIDYYVLFYLQVNCDGTLKNWQWFTYDGQRWLVTPYDLDQTFGINLYGVVRPADHPIGSLTYGPFWWIHYYYQDEIRQRYHELRDSKVFDADNICQLADDWYERVGESFYEQERTRWPDSPCYGETICRSGWEVCDDWELYDDVPPHNSAYLYQAGDVCKLEGRLWRATTQVSGTKPYIRNSNIDTLQRLHGWISDRIAYLDAYWDYEPPIDGIANLDSSNPLRHLIGIYTLSGIKVDAPTQGIYIYIYSDGTNKKVLIR